MPATDEGEHRRHQRRAASTLPSTPSQSTELKPWATIAAPIMPPISACEELEGRP